jgi:hypothetical protein
MVNESRAMMVAENWSNLLKGKRVRTRTISTTASSPRFKSWFSTNIGTTLKTKRKESFVSGLILHRGELGGICVKNVLE